MIGHTCLSLTPQQEDRVLTMVMEPWPLGMAFSRHNCFLIVAQDCNANAWDPMPVLLAWLPNNEACDWSNAVGRRFDALCDRFGTERITAAIRNRILSNRARRALQGAAESVTV